MAIASLAHQPEASGPSARQFVAQLNAFLRSERTALAEFLLALAEFDRQRGWAELGYTGVFPFLHRELKLSKAAAFFRKTAARLVQRFPEITEPIRDGRLCLTSIVELSKVITTENRASVIPRFFHCSKQEAKAVSAELRPDEAPARRTVVTALQPCAPRGEATKEPDSSPETMSRSVRPGEPRSPEGAISSPPAAAPAVASTPPMSTVTAPQPAGATDAGQLAPPGPMVPVASPAAAPPRDTVDPLTADLRRLHITVSRRFLEKLEAARAALSHRMLGATTEMVLEAALDLLLEKDAKKKGFAAKPRLAPPPPPPGSRYVPAAVRRAVWERDEGRCQWPLESGGVCGSTMQVELDHTRPIGQGGRSTVDGTRLLCKPHNDLAARLAYGDALMDRFTMRKGPTRSAPRPASRDGPRTSGSDDVGRR